MSPGGIKNVYTLWHERRWQERSSPALRVSSSFWPDATKGIMMTARAAQPHTKRKLVLPLQLPCTMSDSLCDQFRAYLLPHTVLFTRRQGGFSSLHSTCSWMYVCQRVIEDQWFSAFFWQLMPFSGSKFPHDSCFIQVFYPYIPAHPEQHFNCRASERERWHIFIFYTVTVSLWITVCKMRQFTLTTSTKGWFVTHCSVSWI